MKICGFKGKTIPSESLASSFPCNWTYVRFLGRGLREENEAAAAAWLLACLTGRNPEEAETYLALICRDTFPCELTG